MARAAPTAFAPRRPSLALRIGLVGLVAALVGVGMYSVVSRTRSAGSVVADAGRDARPARDAAADAAYDAPPVDAAPVGIDAPVDAPVDAAPAGKKGATIAAPMHSGKRGHLHVEGEPIRTVYVDGVKLGDMPIDRDLEVGKHTVKLTTINDNGVEVTVQTRAIQIREGQTTAVVP